jgi:hypothetical protein
METLKSEKRETLKLGKKYKDIKLFFIKSFEDYIKVQFINDNKEIVKLVQNIRLTIFDYLEPFMVVDIGDLINIILKKFRKYGEIYILAYIENVFDSYFYNILVEHVIKKRMVPQETDEKYLEILTRNNMFYLGIIQIEILKIIFIKSILMNNKISNPDLYKPGVDKIYQESIMESKKMIQYYYNDLNKNFNKSVDVINKCKELIIKNKVLV